MYRTLSLSIAGLLLNLFISAQTPGLIIKPATGPGKTILDPDGDGYVSKKTPPVTGIQLGFSANDILESQIPFAPIVKPDPQGDPLAGPSCMYNEIVGTDAAGNNAVMTYYDGTNLLFRFRLGGYAANSKGYSLLIDTDQKFGFTGINADPGAVPGNPGFEVEIVLETNFGVEVYNVAGTATPGIVVPFSTNPYSVNCQKSIALTTACSDPDYFYDFYIPFSQLSGIAGLGITPATPLRIVAVTSMNPHPAIGNNAISDVGGVTSGNNLDAIYSTLVEGMTPTSVTNINSGGIPDRSACPSVNPVGLGSTTVSGTTSEAAGTINVSIYQSNGTALLGSASTSTITGGNWSVNLSSFSPSVTLQAGQVVKATMTAVSKGTSWDNCDIEIVKTTICSEKTSLSGITSITEPSSGKGLVVANTYAAGTVFTLYNSSFVQAVIPNVTNPITLATNGQSASFTCGTGNCFPDGRYYVTVREAGKCESDYTSACAGVSASVVPTLTTNPITTSTSSLSGNGTTASSEILIYADGIQIATTTSAATSPFAWSSPVANLRQCQVITVKQVSSGLCFSPATAGVTVSRQALKPVINFSGCSSNPTVTSVSGFSTEAAGTTVSLYRNNSSGTLLGTATVLANGTWTVTSLSLSAGSVIAAKVTAGSCLYPSADSDPVTITTKTDIANYTIAINTPTEGQTSVSGTVSGGTYPLALRLYVDETSVGTPLTVNSAGNWTVSGLNSFDLAVGSKVQVSVSSTGCESSLSSASATVQCLAPASRTVSAAVTSLCAGSYGTITVQNSESGIIYTPVLSDGTTVFGYGSVGTGSDLNLTTGLLTTNTVVRIRAAKLPLAGCTALMPSSVSFTVNPLPAAPAAASPQTYCATGSTTLADLSVTPPSGCEVVWYNASSGGATLGSSTLLVPGNTYYAESRNITTGCVSSTRRAVTVQNGTPAAPVAAANQSLCPGATVSNIAASLSGPGIINWYSAPSGGSLLGGATPLVSGTAYYAETSHNSCVSAARTAVTVTLISLEFSVNDASVFEDNTGNNPNLTFTVSLNAAYCSDVTVDYNTVPGTASTADNDFTALSGTLTIPSGSTTGLVNIVIRGDGKYELDENFYLNISNPSAGIISDFSGTATILNDDTQPDVTLSATSLSISEAAGSSTLTAALSNSSYQNVTVAFAFTGTSAGGGTDYTASASSVIIPSGSLSASITISAVQDALVEGNESIIADISSVTNGTESIEQRVTIILADDDITDNPPVINDAVVTISENTPAATTVYDVNDAVSLNDNDQDGQPLTYSITGGNSSGAFAINPSTGVITVADASQLDFENTVLFALAVTATDGINSEDATITVNLSNLNDNAPQSTGESYTVDEGGTVSENPDGLLGNDTDADGNAITAIKVSGPLHGTLTLNADGSFIYVHDGSESLSDSFTYKANDGLFDGNTVTVSISVNPINDAPIALPDSYSVNEGGTLTVNAASGVLANDTDAEGNGLNAVEITSVTHGTLTLNANGSFTYVHDGTETTSDSFTYLANDGSDDGNIVTVSIAINPVNDAPVALADSYSVNEGASLNIPAGTGVLSNDTDAEASPLNATKVSDPAHGTLTLNPNGSFIYTHDGSETNSDSFTYKPNDGASDGNTVTVTITINPVNDAPVAVADAYSLNEGGTLAVPAATGVLANDSDAEGSVITAVLVTTTIHGTLTFNPNGSFTYVHDGSETTNDSFTYRPNDGLTNGSPVTVSLTIIPVNNPPVTVPDSYTFNEGATANVPAASGLLANDTDAEGNTLRAIKVTDPSHGTVTVISNGSFSYTHDGSETTSDSFTYKSNDGTSDGNTVTVTITVNPVNDIPSGVADSYSVSEGGSLIINASSGVLSNDTDAEGSALTAIKLSDPLHGILTLNPNGSFTYVHDGSEPASDSFSYKPNDGTIDGNMVTVTVTIIQVNDTPVTLADSYSVSEGSSLSVPAVSGVLSNDNDPEGATLTATLLTAPLNGTLSLQSNGAFIYTHNGSETLSDSFSYIAGDGTASSGPTVVTITVLPVNDLPVSVADSYTVSEGNTLTVPAGTGVLSNDSDAEGSTLTAVKVSDPVHGTLVFSSNGSFIYTHDGSETTSDSFNYRANDGTAPGNTVTVTISIIPVNDLPQSTADSYSVQEGSLLTVNTASGVLANDTDIEGSSLSAIKVSDPLHGILTLSASGAFTYQHDGSEFGTDSFTYRASDGTDAGNIVTVTITIIPINDAPVSVADTYAVAEGGTLTVPAAGGVLANDTDADGSILTAIRLTNTVNGTLAFNSDGSFVYVHNGSETTSDIFTYKSNDGALDGNIVTVTIIVNPVNGAPLTIADSYTVSEGGTLVVAAASGVLANDTDNEGATLTAIKVTNPSNGTLTFNPDGSFTYIHNGSETTSDGFQYKSNDGTLDGNSVTVTLTITPVNDPPLVSDLSRSVNEDAVLTFATADFTSKYSDAEGSAMDRIRITSLPANGSLKFMNNPVSINDEIATAQLGSLTFTPAANWSGSTSFGWNGSDGTIYASAGATVNITVSQVNDPPQILNAVLQVTMSQGSGAYTVVIAGNIVNPDGDVQTTTVSAAPKHGTASIDGSGNVLYTPDAAFAGRDSVSYRVCDNGTPQLCAEGKIIFTVNAVIPPNHPPVVSDLIIEMRQGDSYAFKAADFTSKYTDADGDAMIKIRITSIPSTGTLTLSGAPVISGQEIPAASLNNLIFTPAGTFFGDTYFSWSAYDGDDYSQAASVNITVTKRELFIPEGFSPNGDGINDFFIIKGADTYVVSLRVYNRWGNLVFQDREYGNDWDGIANSGLLIGSRLPDGTYYYIVNFNNGEKEQVGYITINR